MKTLTVKNDQPQAGKVGKANVYTLRHDFLGGNLGRKVAQAGTAMLGVLLMAPMAFAQSANSIGGVSNTVASQVPMVIDLMTKGGFALGVVFLLLSISKFRQHHEDARSVPMKVPVVLFALSICLIALPWVVSVGKGTLGVNGAENSATGSVYNNF